MWRNFSLELHLLDSDQARLSLRFAKLLLLDSLDYVITMFSLPFSSQQCSAPDIVANSTDSLCMATVFNAPYIMRTFSSIS